MSYDPTQLLTLPRGAEVIRWIDGDTVKLRADLGFGNEQTIDVRIIGYDAPEEGHRGYDIAKARAEELMPVGSIVVFQSFKPKARSFTRWLGHVYQLQGESIAARMLSEHLSKVDFA